MKINFIMPCKPKSPSGGFKVVYEYSKKLVEDGYDVTITYPFLHSFHGVPFKKGKKNQLKYYLRFLKDKFFRKTTCKYWFPLSKEIKERLVFKLEEKYLPESDLIVATAWSTAEEIAKLSETKGEKIYLIQSFEDWGGTKERVLATWKAPLKKIVISQYLKNIAHDLNEKAELIENGLNFTDFYCDENIAKEKNSILMMYHSNEEVKRSKEAIREIIKLKNGQNKNIKLRVFGVEKRPDFFPDWIEYFQKPRISQLRELYNKSEIYVSSSKVEGWPLPIAEALQCKTMICITDIPGHSHIRHMETGYKIKELKELPETLSFLLKNDDLRERLAENGNKYIVNFTWERAYKKLKKVLEKNNEKNRV